MVDPFGRCANMSSDVGNTALDTPELDIIKGRDGVYSTLNEGSLDISNRIIRSEQVGK